MSNCCVVHYDLETFSFINYKPYTRFTNATLSLVYNNQSNLIRSFGSNSKIDGKNILYFCDYTVFNSYYYAYSMGNIGDNDCRIYYSLTYLYSKNNISILGIFSIYLSSSGDFKIRWVDRTHNIYYNKDYLKKILQTQKFSIKHYFTIIVILHLFI